MTNSLTWRAATGKEPPTVPFTADEYTRRGLPWFEYYAEGATAVEPENVPITPRTVIELRAGLKRGQVREGVF